MVDSGRGYVLSIWWLKVTPQLLKLQKKPHLRMKKVKATPAGKASLTSKASGVALMINRWKPRLLAIPTLAFTMIAISNSLVIISYA